MGVQDKDSRDIPQVIGKLTGVFKIVEKYESLGWNVTTTSTSPCSVEYATYVSS